MSTSSQSDETWGAAPDSALSSSSPDRKGRPPVPTSMQQHSPKEYKQCRSLGHEWRHFAAERHGDRICQRSRCTDCKTERAKWISRAGFLLGTTYTYPDGYSLHGDERIPNHEWRSLYVETLFEPNGAKSKKRSAA